MQLVLMVARLASLKGYDQIREAYKPVWHLTNVLIKLWKKEVSQDQMPSHEHKRCINTSAPFFHRRCVSNHCDLSCISFLFDGFIGFDIYFSFARFPDRQKPWLFQKAVCLIGWWFLRNGFAFILEPFRVRFFALIWCLAG